MTAKKSSFLKKLILIFGGLFGLLLLAALIVPFVVDVDKYRPKIVSIANEKLNGKLELGKLGLSLWGKVKIDIDGLKLTDSAGRPVIQVKDASFHLPLMSVISGSPELRLKLMQPAVNVVKQKDGKMNVATLMKSAPGSTGGDGSAAPSAGSGNAGAKSGEASGVPAIVLHSRLTFLIDDAKIAYKDEITGDLYKIDADVKIQDVSPSATMPFEITAKLDLLMQKKIKITGPLTFKGSAKAVSSGSEFQKADLKAAINLDGAEINHPGVFHKKSGVALGADAVGTVSKDAFDFSVLKLKLADVSLDAKASGKTADESTSIDFSVHSNEIDVAKLGDLSPLVKEYGLNGLIKLSAKAHGPTDKLDYSANLVFNKISLSHESLKQSLDVNGSLELATNELKNLSIAMSAKNFDATLSGSLQNFLQPRFKFNLASKKMDLDSLLKSSAKAEEARKERASKSDDTESASAPAGQPPVVDYNAMFKPLRENAIAAAAAGTFDFTLKDIKSTGVEISDFKGQLALNNLLLALKDFSMKIFDGSVKGSMSFNAKPAKPEVGTNLLVAGLRTQKMVENHMPIARNTVKGTINANLNIGGPGLNQPDIVSSWKGNGEFEIANAVFSTLDVGKQIRDGVIGKLPEFARGKVKVPESLLNRQGEYQWVKVKYALSQGTLTINEIDGKAHPNSGLDLKGNGNVKLANYGLELNLDLIDTYNLTGGDEIAKDKRYGHFTLSPRVTGTLFSPKFDWGSTIGKLAQSAAETKGRQALQKAVGDKIPGLGKIFGGGGSKSEGGKEQPAQKPADAVKGALKGLFGR